MSNENISGTTYSTSYTNYVLATLVFVYLFNFVDRQILAILAPAIKTDLGLSDTHIGLLSGAAFGIFYATLGIPIARLADKYSRVNIISTSLALWSLMTALSGFAGNFWHLLIARIGVGIGEAGSTPPSHSLISDYFAPHKRASALGIFALGIPLGVMVGNFAGGWISDVYGWRSAFFIVGIPGVLLALLLKLTVKEPARGHSEGRTPTTKNVPFLAFFITMWGLKSFRNMTLGASAISFVSYGMVTWMASFLVRAHGMSLSEVGIALGLIIGIFGGAGALVSGVLCDRLGKRNRRWYLWIPALGSLIAMPLMCFVYLHNSLYLVLAVFCMPVFLTNIFMGPTFAMGQGLAPLSMRAASSALMLFVQNMIGLLLGPTAIGVISDVLQKAWQFTEVESLRWALIVCNFVLLLSTYLYFKAAKTLELDLDQSLIKDASDRLAKEINNGITS